jgi:ribosomal protein S27E
MLIKATGEWPEGHKDLQMYLSHHRSTVLGHRRTQWEWPGGREAHWICSLCSRTALSHSHYRSSGPTFSSVHCIGMHHRKSQCTWSSLSRYTECHSCGTVASSTQTSKAVHIVQWLRWELPHRMGAITGDPTRANSGELGAWSCCRVYIRAVTAGAKGMWLCLESHQVAA